MSDVDHLNREWLHAIATAPDWPTTRRLMHERDQWWRSVRRWCPERGAWVEVDRPGETAEAYESKEATNGNHP